MQFAYAALFDPFFLGAFDAKIVHAYHPTFSAHLMVDCIASPTRDCGTSQKVTNCSKLERSAFFKHRYSYDILIHLLLQDSLLTAEWEALKTTLQVTLIKQFEGC